MTARPPAVLTTLLQKMRPVMRWGNPLLCFVATATLAAVQLCNGQAADSEQRPSSPGSLHFRSVVSDGKHDPAAPTRHGSLALKLDEHGDQSPSPVFRNWMDAKLRRMDPSVQCSDNLMTLKVKWVRAPHFLVDSGEVPLTPLSQMPSKCGLSVKRSRRHVHVVAPYQGCHVTQQGGNYVLPLYLWGAPMTMSCQAVSQPPSVSCFPAGMVLKISGITANALKVRVSGTWESLSSVSRSCGFAVEVCSGGLTLTAQYNRGLCIVNRDEEYILSLLLADVELLVTCPSLPDIKPTTATTTLTMPPRDSGLVLQYPPYPQFPIFPQYPVFPGPTPPTLAPENQQAPAAPHPAFLFMPQYQQYPFIPRPVPPTQSAAPPAQLPPMLQSPQYPFPFFPQFPMAPGIFPPPTPPPAASIDALEIIPASTTKHDGMLDVPQQRQFPMYPQYLAFPGPTPPTRTPAPTTSTVAPLPQHLQLLTGAATDSNTENQQAPSGQHPAFLFMPQYQQFQQYPQLLQYPFIPRPVPPTQSAAPPAQLPPMLQSPQYPFPFFPQFPMATGIFPPPTPPPAASIDALEIIPASTTKHDGMLDVPQQRQFPMYPQYPFLSFPKAEDQTKALLEHKLRHVYPQTYQIPVLYPPQRRSAQLPP